MPEDLTRRDLLNRGAVALGAGLVPAALNPGLLHPISILPKLLLPPAASTLATGFADLVGSAYLQAADVLLVTDAGDGQIDSIEVHTHAQSVRGIGYNDPSDIALSVDGLHAYVTEEPGTLLRVPLADLNRSAAAVVASGLDGIDQVALDEAHGFAYVAEFTGGHLRRVNLTTSAVTVVGDVFAPRGVAVTKDGRYAYVSSDAGTITRFDFATDTSVVVASGLNGPRHLTWSDSAQSAIFFPEPNPTGRVLRLEVTGSLAGSVTVVATAPAAPYSVALRASNDILITSASAVSEVNLTGSVYSASGPILLGIGFVPADSVHVPNGYADTTMDPSYFFQVKDCPFGGTLPLMLNWQGARAAGAQYYQVLLTGPSGPAVEVAQPFSDYLWSAPHNRFELVTTVPSAGYYPLRSSSQLWLNEWLGLLLDTTGRPAGLNRISVKLYSARSPLAEIGTATDPGRFVDVVIDNTQPTAIIEQILQEPGSMPVNACGIVSAGSPTFAFRVTASAPAHLRSWSLLSYWGNNQSASVSSDEYSNHITASRLWAGVSDTAVPPPGPAPWNATVAGDPTSTHCAHTFVLAAWDRIINGWGYVHGPATYQQSITLLF